MSRQTILRRKAGKQKGYTLVELMVAMAIGLILTAGILQLFVSNKQTYRVTENMSRLQENGRFAMFFLTNDIRMAGYMGCAGQASITTNTLDDSLSPFLYGFGKVVEGFEASSSSAWTPTVDTSINSPLGGSDIIAIRGISSSGIPITGQPSNAGDCNNSASHTANIKVSNASSLKKGDIVIAGNCSHTSIFQISSNNGATTVTHNTGNIVISGVTQPPGNTTTNLGACYAGSGQLYKMATKVFFIKNNSAGKPALYLKINNADSQELVEGIENMQILYGEDTDGDGAANYYKAAGSVDMDNVVSVRISLVAVTLENFVTDQANPITIFGSSYTPLPPSPLPANYVDKHIRRTFTSTIVIRNRLP